MPPPVASKSPIHFGVFEVDLEAGELRKQGVKVKLQEQPFQVLAVLLEKPGRVVTREELQKRLWSDDTFVDFETGLNTAIKKIREALGDSADNPRFVETLHRRGYRFIAPVVGAGPALSGMPAHGRSLGVPLRIAVALLAAALAIAAGIGILRKLKQTPEAELVPIPLTSYPGYEAYPSFSPDGTQVAFQWCPDEPLSNCDIYVKQIGMEPPSRLTTDPAIDFSPAWSPDGRFIAFLRKTSPTKTALILIPQRVGPERVLGEYPTAFFPFEGLLHGSYLTWAPDSQWLAVAGDEAGIAGNGLFLLNVETREVRRLTASGGNTPAFSPDGRILAFNRVGSPHRICLLPLTRDYQPEGEPREVATVAESIIRNFGAAWSSDGRDVVFSSGNYVNITLWRVAVTAGGVPRRLAFAGEGASAPAVSRQGNRLAYVVNRSDNNIWRIELSNLGRRPGIPTRLIASTRVEVDPAYSPDGKQIAFVSGRSGAFEIWKCASDGSDPVQVTALGGPIILGPEWSPDGQSITFTADPHGNQDIYVVSANGGLPRRLTNHPAPDKWPFWSHDGKSLYFCSTRSGSDEIWKIPAAGGKAIQITHHGGDAPQESPDGKFIYYLKGWPSHCAVWKVPAAGGEESRLLDPVHPEGLWAVGKQGIYFFTPPDRQGHSDIRLYESATGKTTRIQSIERQVGERIAISPDDRTILYSQFDQTGSDLMLVENFR